MFIDYFRAREGEERVRETSIGYLPYAPQLGIESATWVHALKGIEPTTFLVCRMMLQPIEPPCAGFMDFFFFFFTP